MVARASQHECMNSTNTSIGRGPASGGNENHDGDPTRKTLGETVEQEAPAGNPHAGELVQEPPPSAPKDEPRR